MKIEKAQLVPITGGWYCDDKAAFIFGDVQTDHYLVRGEPRTPGFKNVREVGRGVCVILHLENGLVAYGDGVSVTYAGSAGRDPIFRFGEHAEPNRELIESFLVGKDVTQFADLAHVLYDHVRDLANRHDECIGHRVDVFFVGVQSRH